MAVLKRGEQIEQGGQTHAQQQAMFSNPTNYLQPLLIGEFLKEACFAAASGFERTTHKLGFDFRI